MRQLTQAIYRWLLTFPRISTIDVQDCLMIKLTDWTVQRWSDDGKMNLIFRLRLRIHTLPIIFCNILWYLNWQLRCFTFHW